MSAKPVRLRLSRVSGFSLQDHSRTTNGLPAVVVARPTKWGNPFKSAPAYSHDYCTLPEITDAGAVSLYRERMEQMAKSWPSVREMLAELRGHNLACWCRPGAPCHADVLLALANGPLCDEPLAAAE
ncbi:hypothetical protein AOPFMNJM_1684 [Methylobacterium jeotgali]|uniref:DUF4326 domain-containing protein n=1 Tax=Methylobacterium jeotgali TaxID=381630 RepID=A0ABQ4SWU9_9HYPH|nr:DUF4326 domain-containing protein [Methylobacterium jeotgali]GJE06368.1 hypothetical protein AOPFMNJM_1684 [Methylobacterium jeotgali]